jgi:hypothetical protein
MRRDRRTIEEGLGTVGRVKSALTARLRAAMSSRRKTLSQREETTMAVSVARGTGLKGRLLPRGDDVSNASA